MNNNASRQRLVNAFSNFIIINNLEGRCNHFYLDTNNFVTIGIGHLVADVQAAEALESSYHYNFYLKYLKRLIN